MIEITNAYPPEHRLKAGEVIMVKRVLTDKKTQKPFDWRFFALVLDTPHNPGLNSHVFTYIILDGREDRVPLTISTRGLLVGGNQLWFLPESEWPDGVYAFRTKLILEGRIEGVDELF